MAWSFRARRYLHSQDADSGGELEMQLAGTRCRPVRSVIRGVTFRRIEAWHVARYICGRAQSGRDQPLGTSGSEDTTPCRLPPEEKDVAGGRDRCPVLLCNGLLLPLGADSPARPDLGNAGGSVGHLCGGELLVHGHFGAIYAANNAFYAFPGILVVLAPVAALTNALGMSADVFPNHGFAHPQAFLLLGPYEVLLSVLALFACDALGERLGVGWRRRGILA